MPHEQCDYICRAPDIERRHVCRVALESEFGKEHSIKFDEAGELGEEKMYAFKINSGYYIPPDNTIMSACTCPTSPLIYLANRYRNFEIKVYLVKPDDDCNSTTTEQWVPYELNITDDRLER